MFKRISLAIMAAASITAAQAAEITLIGDNYKFTVNDDSLFGTPTLVGDKLVFAPTAFQVQSENTGSLEVAETVIKVTIEALNGAKSIAGIKVSENGNYILGGDGKIRANARLDVFSLSQAGQSTGANVLNTGIQSGATTGSDWSLQGQVPLAWGNDSGVALSLENTLLALAGKNTGDFAFIAKQGATIEVVASEVPVPAAVWLFGSALVGLGLRKSK